MGVCVLCFANFLVQFAGGDLGALQLAIFEDTAPDLCIIHSGESDVFMSSSSLGVPNVLVHIFGPLFVGHLGADCPGEVEGLGPDVGEVALAGDHKEAQPGKGETSPMDVG